MVLANNRARKYRETNWMIVFIAATGERRPQMTLDANNIADLSEIQPELGIRDYSSPAPEPIPTQPQPQPAIQPQPTFVDPAILSVGKRSGSVAAQPPQPAHMARAMQSEGPEAVRRPEQVILDSIQSIKLDTEAQEMPGVPNTPSQKKKGKPRQSKQGKPSANDAQEMSGGHGKGWRQTPMLESTASFQPFKMLKRNGKAGRKILAENGWASEEVTEEMGEFDFENNLAKFDKRTIFDQMRKEDVINDADRLVSHNRLPKPGTAGGKNLHYTEMVLDTPPSKTAQNPDFWNSEADVGVDDAADRTSAREQRNGQSSKRADSRSGISKRSQSRKASAAATSRPLSRVNSSVSLHRAMRAQQGDAERLRQQREQAEQPGLYLKGSDRRLEAVSTLQMLNLENIAANEIGFTEALMAENAGRGIAEVAMTALSDPAMKARFELASKGASLNSSTVVILAGNNKSGMRAMAAGRHLRNKNLDVLVCLVGIERERDLLEDLRRQIQLYRTFGGKIMGKSAFFEHLRKSAASESPVSVSLIIDALLGLTISFEELRIGDQATVYELMEWANRNEAFALSVDVPTGIDPSSGKIAIIDGAQLYLKPRYVVAIAAPKKGLLEAVTPPLDGEPGQFDAAGQEDEWRLYIVDMGLGSAVWRKAGTKIRKGVDFDGKWVLEMQYRGSEVEYDEE